MLVSRIASILSFAAVASLTLQATEYAYVDPVFRVDNPSGATSNSIVNCVFTKTVAGETVASSWAEFSAATSGTLVKDGTGWITIDRDLSKFMGEIHAAAGVLHIHHHFGLGSFLGGAGYAHAGATLYLHQPANGDILPNSSPYDNYCIKALIFEGTGTPEVGAALWIRSERSGESNWSLMRYPTLSGDATLLVDKGSYYMNWRPESELRLNGHTLTLVGAPGQTRPSLRLNNISATAGHLIVRNVKFGMTNLVDLPGDSEASLTLDENGACELTQGNGKKTWTVNYGAKAYYWVLSPQNADGYGYKVGDTNRQAWAGAVNLASDLRLYNNCYLEPRVVSAAEILTNAHHIGLNLHGPVSGNYGIRTFPGVAARYRTDITLGLANPANSFTGGVTLDGTNCTLALYANGALPATGGAASLTNGAVHLVGNDVFDLPDLNMGGTGLVQQTSSSGGRWKTVSKCGPGNLVWNSSSTAATFDIREGVLVLPSFADNVDWSSVAGLKVSTNKYTAANYANGVLFDADRTVLLPEAAYNLKNWSFAGSASTIYSYAGYLWNRAPTNETWSVAMVMDKGGRMTLDGEVIVDQTVRNEAKTANFTIAPGPHAFEFRYFCTSGNSGATGMGYGEGVFKQIDDEYFPTNSVLKHDNPAPGEKGGLWSNNCGFMFDRQGRRTHVYTDYTRAEDPGDGSFFTFSTNQMDVAAGTVPKLEALRFGVGAGFNLNGWNCLSATTLEGLPLIQGGDFTVTRAWSFSGDDVAQGACLSMTGRLTLGPEATLSVTDTASLPRETRVVARAAGGIELPDGVNGQRVGARHYRLVKTADTELTLVYAAGTTLLFR